MIMTSIAANNIILKDENESFSREIGICFDEMKVCAEDIYSIKEKKEVALRFSNFVEFGRKEICLANRCQ